MRPNTHNFALAAAVTLAVVLLCPTLHGTSLQLTGSPTFGYHGILVGPYAATLGTDTDSLVFCLDLHIDTNVGTRYAGSVSEPNARAEVEAAFLASYALYLGAPSGGLVDDVEGPISMAIWELMGTLGATAPDPAAQPFVAFAHSAYSNHLITPAFLSGVTMWIPNPTVSAQRFVTAIRDDSVIENASAPEPGTFVFLGTGVLLLALNGIRRRRCTSRPGSDRNG